MAVSVDCSPAKDIYIVATDLEEGGDVLEDLGEGVGLPVGCVVCEEDSSLDVWDGLVKGFVGRRGNKPMSMEFRNVRFRAVPIK